MTPPPSSPQQQQQQQQPQQQPQQPVLNKPGADAAARVGFTSQITAGFRAVEQEQHAAPLVVDPLAPHLAGAEGLALARREWQALRRGDPQGAGKHARIPARNRLVDDALLAAVARIVAASSSRTAAAAAAAGPGADGGGQVTVVQVVNVGCGMDSKAHRLQAPPGAALRVFDVDQPGVIGLKRRLLQEAGAALSRAAAADAGEDGSTSSSSGSVRFPLLAESWTPVGVNLATTRLSDALRAAGFDPALPAVFVAEALLYYLPLEAAAALLSDMRALLPAAHTSSTSTSTTSSTAAAALPQGKLVATVIDRALLVADHEALRDDHYFAKMWHFCDEELVGGESGGGGVLASAGWAVDEPPRTTAELARERLGGAELYTPSYGGAECVFTADPM